MTTREAKHTHSRERDTHFTRTVIAHCSCGWRKSVPTQNAFARAAKLDSAYGHHLVEAERDRLKAINAELVRALETVIPDCAQNIADIGGCDHSVNICCCDLIEHLEQARATLEKARQ